MASSSKVNKDGTNNIISGGSGHIRKLCIPHSSVGSDCFLRCSVHSVLQPLSSISSEELYHPDNIRLSPISTSELVLKRHEKERILNNAYEEIRVTATVHAMGLPLHPSPATTRPSSTSGRMIRSPGLSFPETNSDKPSSRTYEWDEVLQFPILWKDLTRDACIAFNVLDSADNLLWGTTFCLFDKNGLFRTGLQKIKLHDKEWADAIAGITDQGKTPGVSPSLLARREYYSGGRDHSSDQIPFDGYGPEHEKNDPVWTASLILDRLNREETHNNNRTKSTNNSNTPGGSSTSWLDNLTKNRCNDILNSYSDPDDNMSSSHFALPKPRHSRMNPEDELISSSYLIIEMPTSPVPIVYEEPLYPKTLHGSSGSVTGYDLSLFYKHMDKSINLLNFGITSPPDKDRIVKKDEGALRVIDENDLNLSLVQILDHEHEDDNPVEDKYRTLAHDLIRGLVDPALKPDREQRARLSAIISSPSHHPTREEQDLLWRFRFSLVDNRRALTKFLLAVDWSVESEVVQAAELLEQWRKRSPIEVTDALKLLGKNVAFQTNLVRTYAIDTLAAAPDEELMLYLLQLVQAIKYEDSFLHDKTILPSTSRGVSPLATFLIERASKCLELANYLYWYLKVEIQNPTHGQLYYHVFRALEEKLSKKYLSTFSSVSASHEEVFPPLSNSISSRASTKSVNISSFFETVTKLGKSHIPSESTNNNSDTDANTLSASPSPSHHSLQPPYKKSPSMWDILATQDRFISSIMKCQTIARDEKGKKNEKQNHLRKLLESNNVNEVLSRTGTAIPLPCTPSVLVNGLVASTAIMFKSALYPAVIEFSVEKEVIPSQSSRTTKTNEDKNKTTDSLVNPPKPKSHKVIVKTGDDLRQDQLVIMLIRLFDRILRRDTLNLCLRPYSIIAISPEAGLVEFVDNSLPISQILASHNNSILQYFQKVAPSKSSKYKIQEDVMQTYVRSCAGYCVITYLLGVGDRHLDNIMLQPSGHLFHIDFGFIFGRDPKPLPPPFRLTREMVDGMGGIGSAEYKSFCSLAVQAYNLLRKNAALVLNLLHLMADAGIEDLSNNLSADADGVIAKVEERFRLELTDEQAENFFLGLINETLAAIAPVLMDFIHNISVARR